MNPMPPERGRPGASMAKAVIAALSLLVLGAVLGVAFDRHVRNPYLVSNEGHAMSDRQRHAEAFHELAMSTLAERLDLAPTQRLQIDSILATRHHTLRQTWHALHAQLGAAVDTVHRDIEAVLTPDQRVAFREWLRAASP